MTGADNPLSVIFAKQIELARQLKVALNVLAEINQLIDDATAEMDEIRNESGKE